MRTPTPTPTPPLLVLVLSCRCGSCAAASLPRRRRAPASPRARGDGVGVGGAKLSPIARRQRLAYALSRLSTAVGSSSASSVRGLTDGTGRGPRQGARVMSSRARHWGTLHFFSVIVSGLAPPWAWRRAQSFAALASSSVAAFPPRRGTTWLSRSDSPRRLRGAGSAFGWRRPRRERHLGSRAGACAAVSAHIHYLALNGGHAGGGRAGRGAGASMRARASASGTTLFAGTSAAASSVCLG